MYLMAEPIGGVTRLGADNDKPNRLASSASPLQRTQSVLKVPFTLKVKTRRFSLLLSSCVRRVWNLTFVECFLSGGVNNQDPDPS